jgi:hypothetical protein
MPLLDISVSIEGDKVVIAGLDKISSEMPRAVQRGLERSAIGVYRHAQDFLRGPGGTSKKVRTDYVGFQNKSSGKDVAFRSYQGAGGYPVPMRTGHLMRSLDWLRPGESKSSTIGTFTAGQNEVVIFNSAEYTVPIHEGKGSSSKFGPRRFLTDALAKFNSGYGIEKTITEEIAVEISKAGLK